MYQFQASTLPLANELTRGLVLGILSELKLCLRQGRSPPLRLMAILSLEGAVAYAEACIDRPFNIDAHFNHHYAQNVTGSLEGLYANYPYRHYVDDWERYGLSESTAKNLACQDGIFDAFPDIPMITGRNLARHDPVWALDLLKSGKITNLSLRSLIIGAVEGHADLQLICQFRNYYVDKFGIHETLSDQHVEIQKRINSSTVQHFIFEGILLGGNFDLLDTLLTNPPFDFDLEIANKCQYIETYSDLPEVSLQYLSKTLPGGYDELIIRIMSNFEYKSPAIVRWVLDSGKWETRKVNVFALPAITQAYDARFGYSEVQKLMSNLNSDDIVDISRHKDLLTYAEHLGFKNWAELCLIIIFNTRNMYLLQSYCSKFTSKISTVKTSTSALPDFERVAREHGIVINII